MDQMTMKALFMLGYKVTGNVHEEPIIERHRQDGPCAERYKVDRVDPVLLNGQTRVYVSLKALNSAKRRTVSYKLA